MTKRLFIFLLIIEGVLAFVSARKLPHVKTAKIQIGDTALTVEIADTPQLREKGLSGRLNLSNNHGMLFVFPKPDRYTFWMKDMKIPLDFVWIANNRVVDLTPNVPPPAPGETLKTYQPQEPVDMVLELNAGDISQLGISLNQTLYTK